MEHEISFGEKVLNGFLRVMVVILVGILLAVVVAVFLSLFGIL